MQVLIGIILSLLAIFAVSALITLLAVYLESKYGSSTGYYDNLDDDEKY